MQNYHYNDETQTYTCDICGRSFEKGEIFQIDDRFFDAEKAVEKHIETDHPDHILKMIDNDSKYNSLTERQKKLFQCFYKGMTDKEIAKELGVSTSTVRHQRFSFREKAKQAKYYLSLYESVFNKENEQEKFIPIKHEPKYIDDRYVVTESERQQILKNSFDSLVPLKLKHFPVKAKRQYVILTEIAGTIKDNHTYSEKEINEHLKGIYNDYVMIRRFLIDYGFLTRNQKGTEYNLNKLVQDVAD